MALPDNWVYAGRGTSQQVTSTVTTKGRMMTRFRVVTAMSAVLVGLGIPSVVVVGASEHDYPSRLEIGNAYQQRHRP
jgi:hypothetical protein